MGQFTKGCSLALLLLLFCGSAQGADLSVLAKDLLDSFQGATKDWVGPLQKVAMWLLLSLATISLVWKFGLLALQQADFQEFVVELFRLILFVGFFMALIEHAEEWSGALINGFFWTANYAAGDPVSLMESNPASIFDRGLALSRRITASATGFGSTLLFSFLVIPVMILYTMIATFVLLVFCEAYVVTAAGIILLGFGGNQWTNDYAVRYITYCVSVGMKLFVMLLIVGLGEQLVHKSILNSRLDLGAFDTVLMVIGILVMLVALVWMLPNIVQGIVNGSTIGSGAGSFGAVAGLAGGAAAGAAMGMGKSAITGTTAVMEAAKLAQDQISTGKAGGRLAQSVSQLGQYAPPGFKAGALAATTAKNLGQAAASVAGDMARGQGGGKLLPEVAKAVHAASVQSGAEAALQAASGSPAGPGASSAASGSPAGSGASPETPPADPMGDHQAEVRALAAEDQREVPPLDAYQSEMRDMEKEGITSTEPSTVDARAMKIARSVAADSEIAVKV